MDLTPTARLSARTATVSNSCRFFLSFLGNSRENGDVLLAYLLTLSVSFLHGCGLFEWTYQISQTDHGEIGYSHELNTTNQRVLNVLIEHTASLVALSWVKG